MNVVLFKSALKIYRHQKLFQIDPANSLFYSDLNKEIINKKKIRYELFYSGIHASISGIRYQNYRAVNS